MSVASQTSIEPDKSFLVSLVVIATHDLGRFRDDVLRSAMFLQARFAFFEILLVESEGEGARDALMAEIGGRAPQTRLLQIEGDHDFDRLAMHGYQECIGDIVVLTSVDELPFIDLEALLEPMRRGGDLVRLRRKSGSALGGFSSMLVRSITGLSVDTRFLRTLALNRQILSELLARPEEIHLFRFNAHRLFGPQTVLETDRAPERGGIERLVRRIDLVTRLIATSAPRLLRFAGAACALVSVAALLTLVYVLVVWLVKSDVAEGWTTTTVLLGVWMFVQNGATAVLCLGLSRLLDREERSRPPRLLNEMTVSDLFQNSGLLNVEASGAARNANP